MEFALWYPENITIMMGIVTYKLYHLNTSLIEGVGSVAHVAGPTSGRSAVAFGAVYSAVNIGRCRMVRRVCALPHVMFRNMLRKLVVLFVSV